MGRDTLELFRLPEEKEIRDYLSNILNVPALTQIAQKIPPKDSDKEYYYFLKANSIQANSGFVQPLEDLFAEIKRHLGLEDK